MRHQADMDDAAATAYRDIAARVSPEMKVVVMHQLRQTIWEAKASWLHSRNPELTDEQVQALVRESFLRADQ